MNLYPRFGVRESVKVHAYEECLRLEAEKFAPKSDCNIVISRGPTLVEWTGAKNFIMLFRGLLKANSPTAKVRRNDAALKSLSTGSRLNIRFSSKSVTSIWFKLLDIV